MCALPMGNAEIELKDRKEQNPSAEQWKLKKKISCQKAKLKPTRGKDPVKSESLRPKAHRSHR